tara:strand:+ start:22591 stop:23583 length:993 start_codon:yes stop_codon:yes gene_type:complete
MVNVAINGFGRIGRLVLRAGINDRHINWVAVNDLTDPKTLAHLFKYDSVHRKYGGTVDYTDDELIIDGKKIKVLSEKDPAKLPWKKLDVDVVVESTGFFRKRDDAAKHLTAGADKVVLSAPGKSPDITLVKGVNEKEFDKNKHHIISNASCTTNCLAPIAKILHDNFQIQTGFMSTIHAYTSDQHIVDAPHKDLRRARSAAVSIVPTTTGAAKAVTEVIPDLQGKLDGIAFRVPVPDGSITDFVCTVNKQTSVEEINELFKKAASKELKDIMLYTEEPLVSVDILSTPYSAVFDSQLTHVTNNLVKVVAWYDNEMGYSHRTVDLVKQVGK